MIDLTVNEKQLQKTIQRCKERDIIIPTFQQMKHPQLIPDSIKTELKSIGLWDVHPRNLFRISWKNEPVASGGGYAGVNYMALPPELTGVKAKIIALVGKWFPTGAHKVGASFGCLAPRLITGQFDPTSQKAVWPSTGNYCRGGAYDSALLGCESIAILPEEMSKERFEWLAKIAGEVIATPGCESNVKEIFDKCRELRNTRGDDIVIFNQFDEMGNHLWHYEVTGSALAEALKSEMGPNDYYAGIISSTGSAGTIGCGDYLKELFPQSKIVAAEALQCPTLLNNGFGGHRIEGIGDKHVPWIHNVRNTDMVVAVDDEHTIRLLRLFNEEAGCEFLIHNGVDESLVNQLDMLGISSIGNLVGAIKFAKYYELTENDIVMTIFTDSMELYGSRITELNEERGRYTHDNAVRDLELLNNITTDNMLELDYYARKRIHNLKYYTWIEQQGR
ncbi:MAG: pyridoxal-phosphate dependent enzyme, partial [Candidatus Marinimicrobia bacterium]|nr:pyridoxal-phosphate dependent enzyme [Candidatus Neomarinimicrobiota bacterium]